MAPRAPPVLIVHGGARRWASSSVPRKEGLVALSVGVGLGVLAEMMQEEVDEVVGPKGLRNCSGGGSGGG